MLVGFSSNRRCHDEDLEPIAYNTAYFVTKRPRGDSQLNQQVAIDPAKMSLFRHFWKTGPITLLARRILLNSGQVCICLEPVGD